MSEKDFGAMEIVKRNSLYSAGVGIFAIPVVNVAGVAALQVKMLKELADHYEVPFEQDRVKSILSSLVGGVVSTKLGYGMVGTIAKLPLVGPIVSIATLPLFAGGITYAVGKVFMTHFASGGTFLDFDPDKVRSYFSQQVGKAKSTVAAATA
ncbi:MAG: DUF697 domain-containing protein [Acidobacteriota bacterium]|nr:DUF697 domain-containing protein [Acidobacteriota bacterium]